MKDNIFLDEKVISDIHLSDEAIAIYVGFRMLNCFKKNMVMVDSIRYRLYGEDLKGTASEYNKFKLGIFELHEKGIISLIRKIDSKKFEIDESNLYFSTNIDDKNFRYYIKANENDIQKIMLYKKLDENNSKFNNMKLLRYYLIMVSTIHHKDTTRYDSGLKIPNGVGFCSLSTLSEKSNISISAVIKYNNILSSELDLIYISRSNNIILDKDNKISKSITNCYGFIEQKAAIDNYQAQRELLSQNTRKLSKRVNNNRGMKQRYNHIVEWYRNDNSSDNIHYDYIQEVLDYYEEFSKIYLENHHVDIDLLKSAIGKSKGYAF